MRELAYFGRHTVYHLALASGATLRVSSGHEPGGAERPLARGEAVWAHWSPAAPVLLAS